MVVVIIILLVEAHPSIYVALPSVVIVAREISISALREWMAEIGSSTTVKVSFIGKSKTVLQMIALGFMIYAEPFYGLADLRDRPDDLLRRRVADDYLDGHLPARGLAGDDA